MKNEFDSLSNNTMSELLDIYQCRDWGNISWNKFINLFLENFKETTNHWRD